MLNTTLAFIVATLVAGCSQPFTPKTKITEGKIVYVITNNKPQMSSFLPSQMTMFFKNSNVRSTIKGTLNIFCLEQLERRNEENSYTFLRVLDKKIYFSSPKANGLFLFEELKNSKVTLIDGLEKEFLGFKCKKALLTMDDTGIAPIEIYYTDLLKLKAEPNKNTPFNKIPGTLVQFDVIKNHVRFTFTASEITSEKLDDELFTVSPNYQKTTENEMKELITSLLQ